MTADDVIQYAILLIVLLDVVTGCSSDFDPGKTVQGVAAVKRQVGICDCSFGDCGSKARAGGGELAATPDGGDRRR